MSSRRLGDLPGSRDECGCSLDGGRCPTHARIVVEIHEAWVSGSSSVRAELWAMQDGYGSPGRTPAQGPDWSGIRDSSTDAIEQMYRLVHA